MSLPGEMAEQVAAEFLAGRGLKLIERNYRCRFGEIDLIMRHGPTLVFVEVRYRRNDSFGGAVESITAAKREKLASYGATLYGIATGVSGLPLRRCVARRRHQGAPLDRKCIRRVGDCAQTFVQ